MRSRVLPAVGVSVATLALAATFAPMASAHSNGIGAAHQSPASTLVHASPAAKACAAQRANDSGVGIVSQNFESSFDAYDSQGADDFTIKKTCKVTTVDVDGVYFNGSGPADSVNVTFYKAGKKGIGKAVKGGTLKNLKYKDTAAGSFDISLKKALSLTKGHYYVSVQANMDFSVGGEWGWGTNVAQKGDAALWQNPGDGLATGCTKYANMQTCLGDSGEGPDFSFEIN